MNKLTDFWKGVITGVGLAAIMFVLIIAVHIANKRDKELVDYAKKQIEIEELREDYGNRSPADFLEIPDVRRAADGARAEFERKRDEALQHFRSRNTD
jgi:hypothetical protein